MEAVRVAVRVGVATAAVATVEGAMEGVGREGERGGVATAEGATAEGVMAEVGKVAAKAEVAMAEEAKGAVTAEVATEAVMVVAG